MEEGITLRIARLHKAIQKAIYALSRLSSAEENRVIRAELNDAVQQNPLPKGGECPTD